MAEQKQYTHFKDFKSHTVEIDGNDISSLVYEFEIYQDVFSPFWTASMLIVDTQNQIMEKAFTQGSRVNIRLEDRTGFHAFKFIAHQISDRVLIKQQEYGYTIKMIDEAFFRDQQQRISKHFDGKNAGTAAREVLGKLGGTDKVTQCKGDYSFIVPNLSPIAAAEWIAKFAVKDAADVLVYQQKDKQWSFKSVEEMFKDQSPKLIKLVQRPAGMKDKQAELPDYEYAIEQYRFISHMNAIPNTVGGGFANTTLYHDIIKKKAGTKTYSYGDDQPEDKKKKPYKSIEGTELANINYQAVHEENIEEGKKSFNDDYEKWRGSRKSNMLKMDTNRLLVSIPGRIDIHDQLGMMTQVELPSQQDIDTTILYDEHLKFNWVILAMRHVFTQKSFTTIIELGKKRLQKPQE